MIVNRNFHALLIPSAIPIEVSAGTEVEIIQFKGGYATISFSGNLVRVSELDLDAIGLNLPSSSYIDTAILDPKLVDLKVNDEIVLNILKDCYDPEIPVNIVDLGLVYGYTINQQTIDIALTLTSPSCGMGPILIEDIKAKLLRLPNIVAVNVNVVFDPPWTIERMSDLAKVELGLM